MTYQPGIFVKFLSFLCNSMLFNEAVRKSEYRVSNYRKTKLECLQSKIEL